TTRAFLVDEQTNTYSLTRLQLYLWTIASLFGYLYLTLCYSLVQGRLEFANVPAGLPTLLITSVGTSVLAVNIHGGQGQHGCGAAQSVIYRLLQPRRGSGAGASAILPLDDRGGGILCGLDPGLQPRNDR